MFKRNRQRGFTLIELLIVVAIIGIIAAILIPNLLDALQKAKQKRTVADLRDTGTAWMSWLTDQVGAASAGASGKTYLGAVHDPINYDVLFGYLHPSDTFFYMQEVPQNDGWNHEILYAASLANLTSSAVMMSCSPGRNGALLQGTTCDQDWEVAPFVSTDYDQDIIWADGYFVRWPK